MLIKEYFLQYQKAIELHQLPFYVFLDMKKGGCYSDEKTSLDKSRNEVNDTFEYNVTGVLIFFNLIDSC